MDCGSRQASQLLCRLLFTEGSNPLFLHVHIIHQHTDRYVSNTFETIIPNRTAIDYLFLIIVIRKKKKTNFKLQKCHWGCQFWKWPKFLIGSTNMIHPIAFDILSFYFPFNFVRFHIVFIFITCQIKLEGTKCGLYRLFVIFVWFLFYVSLG